MAIIITDADKQTVAELKKDLYQQIRLALDVSAGSTFEAIRNAQNVAHKTFGMYITLRRLGLLGENEKEIQEELDRIERKHISILEEKRRTDRPKWRS